MSGRIRWGEQGNCALVDRESPKSGLPGVRLGSNRKRRRTKWPSRTGGRWLSAVCSIAAVLILVGSSTNTGSPKPGHGLSASSSPLGPNASLAPYYPYLLNTTQFPTPDVLVNSSGNITDPQLTVTQLFNQSVFELAYIVVGPNGNSTVDYQTGVFEPRLAERIFNQSTCPGLGSIYCSLNSNVPIEWGGPLPLNSISFYVTNPMVAGHPLSIASSGSGVAIAFSSGVSSRVLYSNSFGAGPSWTNLTPLPLAGTSPTLALSPCAVLVTTNSSGQLLATSLSLPCSLPSPPGSGGGHHFGPQPQPTVTGVWPNGGSAGTTVLINGTNFAPGFSVTFGNTPGTGLQYISATQVSAVAPAGSLTVDIRVTVGGLTSSLTPLDHFTYTTGPPPPVVASVSPSQALPGAFINISGSNFTSPVSVYFGGATSPSVNFRSSTLLNVQVPWVSGTVHVQACVTGPLCSLYNRGDLFTSMANQSTLGTSAIVASSPVFLPSFGQGHKAEEGVIATLASGNVTFFNSTNLGSTFSASPVATFNSSLGSPIFTRIGDTRLVQASGSPGQVSAVAMGLNVVSVFTGMSQGRSVVESVSSSDGGHTWNGPYLSAPLAGAPQTPVLATSPAGYVYAAWAENGAGFWQVDEAVFSETGRLLQGPQPIPGSGGGAKHATSGTPAVAVDGFQRPLFVWAESNATSGTQIQSTGGFPTAARALATLADAFNRTTTSDFTNLQMSNRSQVNAAIQSLRANISAGRVCSSWTNAVQSVAPQLTWALQRKVWAGWPLQGGSCSPAFTRSTTQIANSAGPLSANTYLGIYSDWVEEALGYARLYEPWWPGTPWYLGSQWTATVPGLPPLHPVDTVGAAANPAGYSVLISPVTVNPTSLWLNATGTFTQNGTRGSANCSNHNTGATGTESWNDFAVPTWFNSTVLVGSTIEGTMSSTSQLPAIFLTNLTPNHDFTWNESIVVTYQEHSSFSDQCNPGVNYNRVTPVFHPGWPTGFAISLGGNFTTVLETSPRTLAVQVSGNKTQGGFQWDYINWNNSIMAEENATLQHTGYNRYSTSSVYRVPENVSFLAQLGQKYWANVSVWTAPGGTNASWRNQVNTHMSSSTSVLTNQTPPCVFTQVANPIGIYWSGSNNVTNITTSGMTLLWYSNQSGIGWAHYNDSDGGQFSQGASVMNLSTSGHPKYEYVAQLHGLRPWGFYRVFVGVSEYSGCLVFTNSASQPWYVQVQSLVSLREYDSPYDSITQQGGGATVYWSVPSQFASKAVLVSGWFEYYPWNNGSRSWNLSAAVQIPFTSLSALLGGSTFTYHWLNSTFQVNLTALTANQTYNASVGLNYTLYNRSFVAGSVPFTFQYLKDSSGDGLTDWEKLRGWAVTYRTAGGSWTSNWTIANPSLWSTNGLTNDFVEKEFGLDTRTVDSASSHMLDTWNLTFGLGPIGGPLQVPTGANFRYWYEAGNYSTAYNWTRSCQYYVPNGTSCNLPPIHTGWSNISGVDSWAWASRVLWNRVALTSFINLSGVKNAGWLRATLGNSSGQWTITISGKLSWGADPLATSTPGDGIADGARVNPLYDEDLVIGSVSANIYSGTGGCPDPGTGSGSYYGWAPLFFVNYTSNGSKYPELASVGNYTRQTNDTHFSGGGNCGRLSNYQVAVPITGTTQNQTIQARLILNKAGPLWAEKFNGTGTSPKRATVVFDSVRGATSSTGCTSHAVCSFSGTNGTLNFSLSVIPAGVRAPTYLWLPNANSTLSNLPWGLKTYIGEQAFNLIEIDSSGVHTAVVPFSTNGSRHYLFTLQNGLNNILVPREQFIFSPLGEAILHGVNTSWLNSSARAPLLNGSTNNTLKFYGSSNPLRNLACYWQNRAINNTTGGSICVNETGTYWKTSSDNVATVISTSAVGLNSGGVPGNRKLENATESGAAVQSILTLNVTNTTGLDLLLAALLDNATGGVNGSFESVTYSIPTMGLGPVVTNSLANSTFNSSGVFGVPSSHWVAPPPPPCTGIFCYTPNLVSGIFTLNGQFYSFVWGIGTSIGVFINDHTPSWLKSLGAAVAQRIASGITLAGKILAASWSIFAIFLRAAVNALFNATLKPIISYLNAYVARLNSTFTLGRADVHGGGSVTVAHQQAFLNALIAMPFLLFTGISAVVTVALYILSALSIGAGYVVGLLVTALTGSLFGPWLKLHTSGLTGTTGFNPTYVHGMYSAISGLGIPASTDSEGATTLSQEIGIGTGVISALLTGIAASITKKAPGLSEMIGFAVGGFGLMISEWELSAHTHNLDLLALCLSGLGFLLGIPDFTNPLPKLLIDTAVFILGAVGMCLVILFGA